MKANKCFLRDTSSQPTTSFQTAAQGNILRGKHYLPSSKYMNSQIPTTGVYHSSNQAIKAKFCSLALPATVDCGIVEIPTYDLWTNAFQLLLSRPPLITILNNNKLHRFGLGKCRIPFFWEAIHLLEKTTVQDYS